MRAAARFCHMATKRPRAGRTPQSQGGGRSLLARQPSPCFWQQTPVIGAPETCTRTPTLRLGCASTATGGVLPLRVPRREPPRRALVSHVADARLTSGGYLRARVL